MENRANESHRTVYVSRGVLQSASNSSKGKRGIHCSGSNCVSLGMTKIVANASVSATEETVLGDKPLSKIGC